MGRQKSWERRQELVECEDWKQINYSDYSKQTNKQKNKKDHSYNNNKKPHKATVIKNSRSPRDALKSNHIGLFKLRTTKKLFYKLTPYSESLLK